MKSSEAVEEEENSFENDGHSVPQKTSVSLDKIDNQTLSKPVLIGEQIEKKENEQVQNKLPDLLQTEDEENYMKEALLSGKKEWGRSKIMIVGEGRAGKTALANSILGRKYENTESTVGINEFTCNVGYASVGGSNADGLWSEYKREKQQKEYEVALAKMIFDKKTGREQMKRGEREEVELELLLGNKNQGGYLQGEEALSTREEGKGKGDDSVLKQKKVTLHDPHPLSKSQSELVPSSSPSSVLVESLQKGSKSIFSSTNAKTSVVQDTVNTKDSHNVNHEVKEKDENVDSPVKKAEIDKSLVMQYLGEKSCVDSKFLISVFDFGGQSVFNVIHPFFLTRFGVYLLVFNMEWLSSNASMEVKEDCLSYITFWLNSIIIHTQNEKGEVAPIFFVGTRKDLVSSPAEHLQISTKLYEVFSSSLAWPYVVENVGAEGPNGRTGLCFYPINNTLSNHDSTMQRLLKKIEETIDSSSYVHVERPLSWFRVIDALKEANVPYMRYKEAERIITGCDIPENKVSLLLRFLHEMGILMWHDEDKLREVVVFDPIEYFVKPATIVICKHVPDEADGTRHVLDIHRTVRKVHGRDFQQMTRHGIITEKLLKALLQQHEENYMHISQLMLKYGLLVPLTVEQVEDKNEDDEALYLAPALLPELKRSKEENENERDRDDRREGEGSISSEFYFLFSPSSELGQMTTICLEDCRHLGFLPHGLFEKLISKAMMWSMKTSDFVSLGTLYGGCCYKNRAELAFGNQTFRISADPHHHMISVMVDGRNPVGVHDRLVEQLKEIIAECLKSLKFISVLRFDAHDGHGHHGSKASHWKTGEGNEEVMFLRLDHIRSVVEKKTTLLINVRGGRSLLNAQEAMKMYDAWLVDSTVFDEYDMFISYRWGERDSEFTLALFDRMTLYAVGESRRSIQAFLDRKRLQMGENFQSGFVKALLKSLVMVPIVSAEALERMTKMRVEEEDNVLIEWICGLECMKAVEKKGSGEGEVKTRLMKIMPIFFGSRVDGGVKGVGVDEGCCSSSNEPQIRNLFEEKIIDRLPDFVPSGSISKAKSLLESSDVKMSEEGMRRTVKEIVKEISRFLSLCAWEVQGKSKGKGKGVGEKPLIAYAAESVRAEVESGLMAWQQYVSKHKKKDVHSSHVEMRKNSSEDTNMDKMNVPSSHSVSVQWYERFG